MANTTSPTKRMAGGLGLAALAAAAATTYYFYGKGGKKHRTQAKSWSNTAKTEIVKQIKGMKKVSKVAYDQAVKQVLTKYKQAKKIDPAELASLGMELKGYWDNISKHISKMSTGAKATGAKPAHKPARRPATKRAPRKTHPA
jgi:hypothetical protein